LFDNSTLSLKFNLCLNFEPTREFVQRVVKYIEMLLIILILRLFLCFRCNNVDYLLIKFESMGEFNFEE